MAENSILDTDTHTNCLYLVYLSLLYLRCSPPLVREYPISIMSICTLQDPASAGAGSEALGEQGRGQEEVPTRRLHHPAEGAADVDGQAEGEAHGLHTRLRELRTSEKTSLILNHANFSWV